MTEHRVIGTSVPRMESGDKVTGGLQYLGDLRIPGMLHAKILRSPVPHARVVKVDASAAEKLPGVVAVLTRDDIVDNPDYAFRYGAVVNDQTIVAVDKVRYMGDPVAAVAATSDSIAEEALELIEVEYDELPELIDPEEAAGADAPLIHEEVFLKEQVFADLEDVQPLEGTNICTECHIEKGDVEKGFAESDHIFEERFTIPSSQHCTLEVFTSVARFEPSGKLTLWSTTQNPFVVRDQMAELFHLPLSKVQVLVTFVGGGYGSKLYLKLEPIAAVLAKKTGLPVGITLTRDEVFQTLTKHAAILRLKTGVKKDGTILARQYRVYLDTGAYAEIGPRVLKKNAYGAMGPYLVPNVMIDASLVYTNRAPSGAFRGFGLTQATWCHESQTDMIARALKMDPLEFRLKNILDHGGEWVTGETIRNVGVRECLEKTAAAIEWGTCSQSEDPGKARGKGLACVLKATLTPSMSSATIRLNEDGSATVYVGSVDIGQGSNTVMAQIASEELAMPMDQISVIATDTDACLFDLTTSSSRATFHMGRAVQLAAQDVKKQLACLVAPRFEISPDEVTFEDQTVTGREGQRLTYGELLAKHYDFRGGNLVGTGVVKTSEVDEKGRPQHSAFWLAGSGAAEVEVDKATGTVRLVRYVAGADVGKALNPQAVVGQLRGAAITGMGQALLEELVYQEGLNINPNFLDYNLPRFLDVPEDLQTVIVERPNPNGPYGAKGAGETTLIPVSPAIANAIEDAVGVRIKHLPITPEKVFNALREKEAREKEAAAAIS